VTLLAVLPMTTTLSRTHSISGVRHSFRTAKDALADAKQARLCALRSLQLAEPQTRRIGMVGFFSFGTASPNSMTRRPSVS
jgi:hypothetical protein